jgi:hypothetical protein
MACMTLFAHPLAMATKQLVRVQQYEDASNSTIECKMERSPLHMSWVVVTDGDGNYRLCIRWASDC